MRILHAAIAVALCSATVVSALSPATAETSAAPSQPTRAVQIAGPGLYVPATRTFQFAERNGFAGAFDREYRLTRQTDGEIQAAKLPRPRPDLSVLGPGWRADILGGLTSRQLDADDSAAQVADLHEGETIRYARVAGTDQKTYKASTGSTLTVGADQATETIVLGADTTLVLTWERAGGDWRVTTVGSGSSGTSKVTYDDKGRVTAVADLDTGTGPQRTLALSYAETTTATADGLGDFAGRLKSVEGKSKDDATRTLETYSYDRKGHLRSVTLQKGGTSTVSTYAYDQAGNLTRLKSPSTGTWSLDFSGAQEPKATLVKAADTPSASIMNYPPTCPNASQWMWYTQAECRAASVAHYGWRSSSTRTTPTGHTVMGITYDHCSSPTGNQPGGYDFTVACDMHDYGFGVIGNYYKGATYHMTPDKKSAVDDVFYTTLLDRTCAAYGSPFGCTAWAWTYRQGVRLGDPKNGADATS
ncbi:phospholipase A2 [[Actinomadura] parvosata]|uniref:phospholipase A2 n=1 Tax=[Actinomadura] parvosata TaxID=1955412 RepID=UPI00406D1326